MKKCPNCDTVLESNAKFCAACGFEIPAETVKQQEFNTNYSQSTKVQPSFVAVPQQSRKPTKDRMAAGILALLLGTFGIHKFYLNDMGMGVLYLCFSWTGIPSIIGIIEGILYLIATDEEFQEKYVKF